jgi:D-alanyl-D-alanine carboxypeptidase
MRRQKSLHVAQFHSTAAVPIGLARVIVVATLPFYGPTTVRAQDTNAALDRLIAAYGDVLLRHDGERIYWRDGSAMAVSDGLTHKPFGQMLRGASILDQLSQIYRVGQAAGPPAIDDDPGRFRNEAFFQKLYGDCRKGEVDRRMVGITWLPKTWGKTVRVTGSQGVADRLKAVSEEIDRLPPAVVRAAYPIAGVLSCRPVADTGKMSMHAYGAAIDLNLAFSDYWLWRSKDAAQIPYRNRMPQEIVDTFERHGFIWGGKWYHYDTMHFEYRPELLSEASDAKRQ